MKDIIKRVITKQVIALFAIVFIGIAGLVTSVTANKTVAANQAQCKQTLVDSAGNKAIKVSRDGKRASVTIIVQNIDKCTNKYASLSSWKVPGKDRPIVHPFDNQKFFAHTAKRLKNGRQTLTVNVPQCFYQIDLFSTRKLKPARPAYGQSNSDFLLGPNDYIANFKLGGNKSCEPKQVPKVKDITIVKDASVSEARIDDEFTYTIKVKNTGKVKLTNVRATDTLPAGVIAVGNPNDREVTFTVSKLKINETKSFSFRAKITNTVELGSKLKNVACVVTTELPQDECDDADVRVLVPGETPTPEVPAEKIDVISELPNTGAGSVLGLFSATSILGTVVHRILRRS